MMMLKKKSLYVVVVIIIILLLVAIKVVWFERQHIRAYVTNDVGAPIQTMPANLISADNQPVVRLAVAGDVGTGGKEEYQTAAVMDTFDEQSAFDALLLLGDNIYEYGDPTLAQERVFKPFEAVLDNSTQLISVLGNHDVRNNNGPAQAKALGMPNFWYSVTINSVLIIALDSNQASNPEQLAWLESTLALSTAQWCIVMFHHPAYSAGWHGNSLRVQQHFVPLFEQYEVDLVLAGHDHDYQRMKPVNGVHYVVSGGAAKLRLAGIRDFTEVSWSTYHFVDLAIYAERIEGQAIDHHGRAIDTFVINKTVKN